LKGAKAPSLVSSQDIAKSGFKWYNIDNFELPANEPVIVNTDTQEGPGVHWIILVRLKADKNTLYLVDPLGPENARVTHNLDDASSIMNQRAQQLGINQIAAFPFTLQSKETAHCGQFAEAIAETIRDVVKKYKNPSLDELTDIMAKVFGTNTKGGEKRIKSLF
jgi:hypothetical protein